MGKIITFANQKGGSGKTTLTANLAVLWANSKYKVAVVDGDAQQSLTYWLEARKKYYREEPTGIDHYPFNVRNLNEDLKKIKKKYDFIIIDSPPSITFETIQIIKSSDAVYVPVQPSPLDLMATIPFLNISKAENKKTTVILNRVMPRAKLTDAMIMRLRYAGAKIARSRIFGRIIYAETFSVGRGVVDISVTSDASKEITTVILAAGKSTRFKHSKSKIYQDLAGLSIIEHVYQIAKKISKENVIFVSNKNNNLELKSLFPAAKIVIQKKQKGTADAIYQAKKFLINTNVLILFSDVPLISIESIKKLILNFKRNNSIGSMIAFKTENPFGYGRVVTEDKYVSNVIEELNTTKIQKKIQLCNSGVMLCNSNLLFANISKISNSNIKKEKFLPDIFDIFKKIKKNFNYVLGSEEETLGVNSIKDLIKIDQIYQKNLKNKILENGVILYQPDSIRLSYDTKIKKGVIVEPHVIFKKGVIIESNVLIKSHSVLDNCKINSNCIIGPSARIRPKTQIGKYVKIGNYVEIKNSKIGNNTSISHLSYIGDSNIGNNVNIGAGTITCNYDGKKKNKTIIENNVFVGSNCSLVAPLKIGANSTIGAGSVITQNIPKNHLALERSEVKILRKQGKK